MKLVLMLFGKPDGTILHLAYDLSQFNFFIQSKVKELLLEGIKLSCLEITFGASKIFEYEKYNLRCHIHLQNDGYFGAIVSDFEYPTRIAFSILNQELKNILLNSYNVHQTFKQCQNPQHHDKLLQTQITLQEVKTTMQMNLEEIIKRRENINDLLTKSDDLSRTTTDFEIWAKKQNQCCKYY